MLTLFTSLFTVINRDVLIDFPICLKINKFEYETQYQTLFFYVTFFHSPKYFIFVIVLGHSFCHAYSRFMTLKVQSFLSSNTRFIVDRGKKEATKWKYYIQVFGGDIVSSAPLEQAVDLPKKQAILSSP